MRWIGSLAIVGAVALGARPAAAIDIPDVAGETLTIDISNTTELAYRFDNRNDQQQNGTTLNPAELVDDNYGEWFNRLYVRALYWKFSFGLRLDSAVYFETMDRQDVQDLIVDRLGAPDLELENRFGRELHSRYTSLIYPAKLWLGFKHKRLEVTVGDFYAQLGRGLVFSVRKIDEIGIDTTVRGVKLDYGTKIGEGFRLEGTLFGGQLNPIRIDFPTGRILHGTDNPLFFGFPQAGDFERYEATGPDSFELRRERAKPSYLEDTVVGGNLTMGPKEVQFEANGSALFRQSNSEDQARCLAEVAAAIDAGTTPPRSADDCRADFPAFSSPEATRSHDQLYTFGGSVRVPPVENVFDAYIEAAGQHQREGAVTNITADGSPQRVADLWGYAIYGNVNLNLGPFSAVLEGKHYRRFFSIGANVDQVTPAFAAPEFNVVQYSRPPTASSIYTLFIGSPDNCMSGGRARLDATIADRFRVFGWLGHFVSFSEVDPNNVDCNTDPALRTNTWDAAAGTDFAVDGGKSHYIAWVGARFQNHPEPVQSNDLGVSDIFYREGNVRYDLTQHLAGDFSISALGYHLFRYEPALNPQAWQEGENLLSFNWNPHWAFVFGIEYNTRDDLPDTYFNGQIQYRSKSQDTWHDQLLDLVRIYVGQRRSALRCVGGVCRIYPAFEGARFELASRF